MKNAISKPTGATAVVVNDDPIQRNLLSRLVRKAGLEPRAFTTAEAALADMSAWAAAADGDPGALPALVVTDLYMPGIDGWRFCRLLRSPEYAAFNQVPILVVSATFAGDEPDRIAADLGADAFLPSPVGGKRFVEQVRAILKGRQVRKPLRVLIVEDSKTLAGMLQKAFAVHDYQADTALTARAAADAFAKTAYDVVVLDYHLPDGTGDVLLDAFHAQRPDCVCLMMTIDPGPELALNWMKRGATAYLRKPFEPDYLIELCAQVRRERALLRVQDLLEMRTRELRASEQILNATQRLTKVGGWEWDVATQTMAWTEEVYRIHDMTPGELTPGSPEHIARSQACYTPEDRPVILAAFQRCVEQGEPYDLEFPFTPAKGRRLRIRTTAEAVLVEGRVTKVMGNIMDITERKQAEEEKAKLEAQLQQAQKMESVGRLAGGVAHDFNNMLGVILGHTEIAMGQVDPAQPLHGYLAEIRKAAERAADLTRQLLAFARKQTIAPKVLDLNKTVAGILKMLQRLIGEDIHLDWQPEADLWPVKVDPSQIDQILANLCVNARDAIADVGKIAIEMGNSTLDAAYCADHPGFVTGEYVRLAVSDDGCGMDRETLDKLFEPFFTTKEIGKGTGLGLATAYGIVKQNNGFIDVYSEPGRGTTFTIYLPRHVGKAARTEGAARTALRGRETILLVEDESAILKITKMMLEHQGYTVVAASTPGEAIRLAREHAGEIHLLMTDVIMPEMNGRDLAKNLLALYPDLTRLFMSGYTADLIAHHGVLDQGVHFIQKPFSIKNLAAKVREALDSE